MSRVAVKAYILYSNVMFNTEFWEKQVQYVHIYYKKWLLPV